MHLPVLTALLSVAVVSAVPQGATNNAFTPARNPGLSAFKPFEAMVWPVSDIMSKPEENAPAPPPPNSKSGNTASLTAADSGGMSTMALTADCPNPRVRIEWDAYSNADRQAFVNAIRCLMGRPASGRFPGARSRYEDLVAMHQAFTPNIHGNAKFLLWHRFYLWVFEQLLRNECGFTSPLPWFDETRYSGRFTQSSIFSSQWFGALAINGNCVTNGQFANFACNIGPGPSNSRHCLSRNGNSATANTNSNVVNACNSRSNYADMGSCSEGGAHAYGHNGIGAVMSDVYASPCDPVFWLHHAFIDRNFRIWQNRDRRFTETVNGVDRNGNPLTLDTIFSVGGVLPDTRTRDILYTLGPKLCYRYNY